jgi:hypothetical protein
MKLAIIRVFPFLGPYLALILEQDGNKVKESEIRPECIDQVYLSVFVALYMGL